MHAGVSIKQMVGPLGKFGCLNFSVLGGNDFFIDTSGHLLTVSFGSFKAYRQLMSRGTMVNPRERKKDGAWPSLRTEHIAGSYRNFCGCLQKWRCEGGSPGSEAIK